jgi:hypothetical protein
VNAVGSAVDPSQFNSRSTSLQLFDALARQLGDEVAKVFYEHEYRELGGRLR